jgi:transcriptional regulator with XRE-family HTH domain
MDDLTAQVIQRAKLFKEKTGLSSRDIARLTRISAQHICDFLAGRKGLSTASLTRVLQLLNTNVNQLQARLGPAATAQIAHFQEKGKQMQLDAGGSWIAKEGGDWGKDPVDSTSIAETNKNPARQAPSTDDLEFLAGLAALHQSIIDKINARQAVKSKVNAAGSTEPPRRISDNETSRTAGVRGDLFTKQEHLAWLKQQRLKTEQEIQLQRDIEREQALYWDKRVELLKLKER